MRAKIIGEFLGHEDKVKKTGDKYQVLKFADESGDSFNVNCDEALGPKLIRMVQPYEVIVNIREWNSNHFFQLLEIAKVEHGSRIELALTNGS